ncbi:MAG: class I SAM-dependent methyltransferase [Chitinophagaceae bacterium]|nr:class I SAM-dependent methyltransferase [Chitinophagaceae bacterium]
MSIKSGLINFLQKQSFQPNLFGLFLNPFYFIRRGLFLNIKKMAPRLSGRLLDFGCGRKPYENLFSVDEYIGIDMENTGHEHKNSKIDVFYDGKNIPFPDNSFDSVFCSEVFEHIFNLDEIIVEIKRVMKTGGKMLITVPFAWHEHETPYDFGRYTSFGIKHLLDKHGFEVVEFQKSGNFARVHCQLTALYFYSIINTKNKVLDFILRMLFIIPINVIGSILLILFPVNKTWYFNNVVLAVKK